MFSRQDLVEQLAVDGVPGVVPHGEASEGDCGLQVCARLRRLEAREGLVRLSLV